MDVGIEIYSGLFSFGLEDGFVLSGVDHFLLINSLYETRFINWLS